MNIVLIEERNGTVISRNKKSQLETARKYVAAKLLTEIGKKSTSK